MPRRKRGGMPSRKRDGGGGKKPANSQVSKKNTDQVAGSALQRFKPLVPKLIRPVQLANLHAGRKVPVTLIDADVDWITAFPKRMACDIFQYFHGCLTFDELNEAYRSALWLTAEPQPLSVSPYLAWRATFYLDVFGWMLDIAEANEVDFVAGVAGQVKSLSEMPQADHFQAINPVYMPIYSFDDVDSWQSDIEIWQGLWGSCAGHFAEVEESVSLKLLGELTQAFCFLKQKQAVPSELADAIAVIQKQFQDVFETMVGKQVAELGLDKVDKSVLQQYGLKRSAKKISIVDIEMFLSIDDLSMLLDELTQAERNELEGDSLAFKSMVERVFLLSQKSKAYVLSLRDPVADLNRSDFLVEPESFQKIWSKHFSSVQPVISQSQIDFICPERYMASTPKLEGKLQSFVRDLLSVSRSYLLVRQMKCLLGLRVIIDEEVLKTGKIKEPSFSDDYSCLTISQATVLKLINAVFADDYISVSVEGGQFKMLAGQYFVETNWDARFEQLKQKLIEASEEHVAKQKSEKLDVFYKAYNIEEAYSGAFFNLGQRVIGQAWSNSMVSVPDYCYLEQDSFDKWFRQHFNQEYLIEMPDDKAVTAMVRLSANVEAAKEQRKVLVVDEIEAWLRSMSFSLVNAGDSVKLKHSTFDNGQLTINVSDFLRIGNAFLKPFGAELTSACKVKLTDSTLFQKNCLTGESCERFLADCVENSDISKEARRQVERRQQFLADRLSINKVFEPLSLEFLEGKIANTLCLSISTQKGGWQIHNPLKLECFYQFPKVEAALLGVKEGLSLPETGYRALSSKIATFILEQLADLTGAQLNLEQLTIVLDAKQAQKLARKLLGGEHDPIAEVCDFFISTLKANEKQAGNIVDDLLVDIIHREADIMFSAEKLSAMIAEACEEDAAIEQFIDALWQEVSSKLYKGVPKEIVSELKAEEDEGLWREIAEAIEITVEETGGGENSVSQALFDGGGDDSGHEKTPTPEHMLGSPGVFFSPLDGNGVSGSGKNVAAIPFSPSLSRTVPC
jgi:hypothetical protein